MSSRATVTIYTDKKPYDEGYKAQELGTYIDECPYHDGSDDYRAWHDGYDDAMISNYRRMFESGEIE